MSTSADGIWMYRTTEPLIKQFLIAPCVKNTVRVPPAENIQIQRAIGTVGGLKNTKNLCWVVFFARFYHRAKGLNTTCTTAAACHVRIITTTLRRTVGVLGLSRPEARNTCSPYSHTRYIRLIYWSPESCIPGQIFNTSDRYDLDNLDPNRPL